MDSGALGAEAWWYEVVEQGLCGQFEWRYVAVKPGEVQPAFIVDQDLLAGLPHAVKRLVDRVREGGAPGLHRLGRVKVLMVGCAVGEGAVLARDLEALDRYLSETARREGARLIVFKEMPAAFRCHQPRLEALGYTRVASMPGACLPLTDPSAEAFINRALSRSTRKNLRRKFRSVDAAGGVEMQVVSDITPYLDEAYPLYRQTWERSAYRFEELTRDYFALLGPASGGKVRFFLWRHEGRVVAFAAARVDGERFYDLNLGLDYRIALRLHLYFVTWRDLVNWAIGQGLREYYTGPLNYDPKLHLRMRLAPLDLYIRAVSPWINAVAKRLLPWLGPTRYDKTLARFPNAAEL